MDSLLSYAPTEIPGHLLHGSCLDISYGTYHVPYPTFISPAPSNSGVKFSPVRSISPLFPDLERCQLCLFRDHHSGMSNYPWLSLALVSGLCDFRSSGTKTEITERRLHPLRQFFSPKCNSPSYFAILPLVSLGSGRYLASFTQSSRGTLKLTDALSFILLVPFHPLKTSQEFSKFYHELSTER